MRTLENAANTERHALFDKLPEYLDWVATRLESEEAPDAERDQFTLHHTRERLEQGFDIFELVSEVALLREAVLGTWEQEPEGVRPAEIRRFNEELDHVVALFAAQYVRGRLAAAGPHADDAAAAGA